MKGYVKVKFYTREEVVAGMSEERKKFVPKNILYVEEGFRLAMGLEAFNEAKKDKDKNVIYKFLGFDEVVPLGFSAENAITGLKNQDFKLS